MNKKDRANLCILVAQWEWQQGGSTGEAVGRSNCASAVIRTFNLTEDELRPERAWEIYSLCCPDWSSDELYQYIDDLIENEGHEHVIDIIDKVGFEAFSMHSC